MASGDPSTDPALVLVRAVYPPHLLSPASSTPTSPQQRPFVTLTYAQSLDGKISGPRGKQITLSGAESMRMTHRLRELHDSILVGVGTVLNDDPQLTARIPDLLTLASQPKPVVLDTQLRTPAGCKLLQNAKKGVGKPVTILHASTSTDTALNDGEAKDSELVEAGAELVEISIDDNGRLSLPSALTCPDSSRIFGRSLMVEGGASVISSFLASKLVDLVIVTVAPVLVGAEGVSVTRPGLDVPELEHLATEVFGRDTVFVCRPKYAK
ncbi:hypothetical protein JCM10213_006625 [Rhodosporidiobolus nylandii]